MQTALQYCKGRRKLFNRDGSEMKGLLVVEVLKSNVMIFLCIPRDEPKTPTAGLPHL